MMRFLLFASLFAFSTEAQTNIFTTSTEVRDILKGDYDPVDYSSSSPITNPNSIFQGIQGQVSPDSLKAYIIRLAEFGNRNTGSDTNSTTWGFGAARNWVHSKFENISSSNENRLRTSFLQFDENICGITKHKNVLAVLPGSDVSNHQIIIIEGHMDSRCDVLCDTACLAEGVEDNASGTALVIELARVMSQFSFPQTLVFMVTTGEEQGLWGAKAMAQYCLDNNLPLKAVFNNDVIGGVTCGATSSQPSCPGLDDIDSLQVRLFSQGGFNSHNKQLARFVKLEYKEELKPLSSVPMLLTIMSAEDRSGRGGDHIPFRQLGYPSIRFTSANEHGNASNGPGYEDRQHTSDDLLGMDTNNDQIIDSFFVDFNYLSRNAKINGVAAAVALMGPETPDFELEGKDSTAAPRIDVSISNPDASLSYRIGLRSTILDWDSVYTTTTGSITIYPPQANYFYVSVASVDQNGLESLFGEEKLVNALKLELEEKGAPVVSGLQLLQNRPNPFDESTFISILADQSQIDKIAFIRIRDLTGKLVKEFKMNLQEGMNEIQYEHGFGQVGVYLYSLEVDGKIVDTKQMVFAN
jgi:hypothetical protein